MKKLMFIFVATVFFAGCGKEEMETTNETTPLAESNTSNTMKDSHKRDNQIAAEGPTYGIYYNGVYAGNYKGSLLCVPPRALCYIVISDELEPINDNTVKYTGDEYDGVIFKHYEGDVEITRNFEYVIVTENPSSSQLPDVDFDEEVLSMVQFGEEL